jgi:hypothetical protein
MSDNLTYKVTECCFGVCPFRHSSGTGDYCCHPGIGTGEFTQEEGFELSCEWFEDRVSREFPEWCPLKNADGIYVLA